MRIEMIDHESRTVGHRLSQFGKKKALKIVELGGFNRVRVRLQLRSLIEVFQKLRYSEAGFRKY